MISRSDWKEAKPCFPLFGLIRGSLKRFFKHPWRKRGRFIGSICASPVLYTAVNLRWKASFSLPFAGKRKNVYIHPAFLSFAFSAPRRAPRHKRMHRIRNLRNFELSAGTLPRKKLAAFLMKIDATADTRLPF